eukprot:40099-Eustigmatos_ZCMA.PRE.1
MELVRKRAESDKPVKIRTFASDESLFQATPPKSRAGGSAAARGSQAGRGMQLSVSAGDRGAAGNEAREGGGPLAVA